MKDKIINKIKDLEQESNILFEKIIKNNFQASVEFEMYKSTVNFLNDQIKILNSILSEENNHIGKQNFSIEKIINADQKIHPKIEKENPVSITSIQKEEETTIIPLKKTISLAEKLGEENKREHSIADKLNKNLNQVLNINKKLFFSRELFNNDKSLLDKALEELENHTSKDEVAIFLQKYIQTENLPANKQVVLKEFIELVIKKQ